MSCLFCKIIAKKIPAEVVYEDASVIGILDIHPRSPGHTMIIPKAHAETIFEVSDDEVGALFLAVKKMTNMLKKSFNPDGFTIGINHGAASGQEVDHLHIHIIPRWHGDHGSSIHSVVTNPPQESPLVIAEKIKAI